MFPPFPFRSFLFAFELSVVQRRAALYAHRPGHSSRRGAKLNRGGGIPCPEPPTINPFYFGELPLPVGQIAQLQCVVPSGDLPLNISWAFPGDDAAVARGVTVMKLAERVSLLMIGAVDPRHVGNYTCVASNAAAAASYSAPLAVKGVRQPPPAARSLSHVQCRTFS